MKHPLMFSVLFVLLVPGCSFAQTANEAKSEPAFALVVKAGAGFGTYTPPFGSQDLNKSKIKSGVIPGVELLKSAARLVFGVEGLFNARLEDETHHVIAVQDQFGYLGPDGKEHRYSEPGTVFATADTLMTKKINTMVIGSVYVNTGKPDSQVRFDVGSGFGFGFGELGYSYSTYVHPKLQELTGFKFDLTDSVERFNTYMWKAEVGVTVRIKRHLGIRASVRVMNCVVMPTVGIKF